MPDKTPYGQCGYTWTPPYAIPDMGPYPKIGPGPEQTCILPAGHDGDHRSASKVTAAHAR